MKLSGKRSLEGYEVFPYIAWGLVGGFSLFVYGIVVELQDVTTRLQAQTTNLEQQIADTKTGTADYETEL